VDTTRQSSRFTAMYSAIPSSSTGAKAGEGWLHTAAVSDGAVRVFGLDCEMVLCGDHGPSLARVSLVRITPPQPALDTCILRAGVVLAPRTATPTAAMQGMRRGVAVGRSVSA
jgi:hypothetical protein